MQIEFRCEKEFDRLWSKLKKKYPKEIFDMEGVGKQLDVFQFSKDFFTNKSATADVSIDSNANVTDNSVVAYTSELVKPYEKLNSFYLLWKVAKEQFGIRVANEMVESQINGSIYINDFHGLGSGKPYCFNYSCYDIAVQGLPMVTKIKSLPPKYLYAFKSQVEQFVTIASNSTLGATGLADLLLVMSFFVEDILERKGDAHFKFATEEDCWLYVKENIVSMIYTVNQPMRANQSPFTNISIFDAVFLRKLQKDYIHPTKGTPLNIEIVQRLQELFIDIMNKELERTPITFPVTSACFSRDMEFNIKDEEFLNMIAEKSLKFGFMNFYVGKSSTLSSCCRLRSDMENDYFNSFGAGSSKIGSLGVCTVNYPRLAFKHLAQEPENKEVRIANFTKELKHMVELCFRVNYCKRLIVEEKINKGYHPLYTLGFIELDKQYLTQGVNGFNEMIEILGEDPLSEQGVKLGLDVIKVANRVNNKLGAKYKVPVNIEQIPAENTSVKLASKDKLLGINDGRYNLYSNQFIPLVTDADMLDRIILQGTYDEHFSGGSICHLNVESEIEAVEQLKDLIKTSAKKGVVYVAINYNLQECEDGHMSVGKRDTCPICGKPIENNYTRVVGFLTCTKHWHEVRRQEDYPNRKFY